MADYHATLERAFREAMTPELVIRAVLRRRLGARLPDIPDSVVDTFIDGIVFDQPNKATFTCDSLGDAYQSLPSQEQAALEADLAQPVDDDELGAVLDTAAQHAADAIPELLETQSTRAWNRIMEHIQDIYNHNALDRFDAADGVAHVWGEALDAVEAFVSLAREAGATYAVGDPALSDTADPMVHDTLLRLHARACVVSMEVVCLLRHGYGDGAHARWRSLHEISVVAAIIKEHGRPIAERYLLHEHIESYEAARQLHGVHSGDAPGPTSDELEQLLQVRDKLVRRFGRPFRTPNGWAASITGNDYPRFHDLERIADLSSLASSYKLASHNVHANPKGISFKLGTPDTDSRVILAGPSVYGLDEAAFGVLTSLGLVTISLFTHDPTIDGMIAIGILRRLRDQADQALTAAIELRASLPTEGVPYAVPEE